jgi:UDP-GlcNAc:undecaprenyl-phosphate/decaprenyl-phosphate GlcNAc-1-phosphate transferase
MNMMWVYWIVFGLAFSLALALMPLAVWLSHRYGIVSRPGGRRKEALPMPKLGGLPIFAAFIVTIVAAQWLPVPRPDPNEIIRLWGLVIGSAFIFAVGVVDDLRELSALVQGVCQIIVAGIAIACLIFIEYVNNPLTGAQTDVFPYVVTVVLSMFWLGLMMNTVNFLDGLDGLAGGVVAIASVILFINSAFVVQPAQVSVSLLPLALFGATLAFLLYNFYPARVYMGGSALFMGYALGVLSIIGGAKMATILLVMGLPLMDVAWQIVNRLRQGRNPMVGDRGHLHFRLSDLGFTARQIVIPYYLFCACFGVLTLLIESQLYKFIALGVMLLLVALGFAVLSRRQPAAVLPAVSATQEDSA